MKEEGLCRCVYIHFNEDSADNDFVEKKYSILVAVK